jgi:hypothetical protein
MKFLAFTVIGMLVTLAVAAWSLDAAIRALFW